MYIESGAFEKEEKIPTQFTCDGKNISPSIAFHDIPQATESFVLLMDDPDSPTGTWSHWVMWNIPADIRVIEEGTVPKGALEGVTDFEKVGYGGPCPGVGVHRYVFTLHALDTTLDLSEGATKHEVQKAMKGHVLAGAELLAWYERKGV